MTNNRFEVLKQSLLQAKDFSVPWDLFHDNFASDAQFMTFGRIASSQRIETCLEVVAGKLLGEAHRPKDLQSLHIPEFHFWHGTAELGPRVAIFFYFEDVDVGLVGVLHSLAESRVDLVRLTAVEVPEGTRALGGRVRGRVMN